MNYRNLFKDKVIIITGTGRSGTTIIGKIIGSMEPCYYLFEPSIMKFYDSVDAFRSVLFEDYWMLQVQGRNVNVNSTEDSYIGNYISRGRIRTREDALNRCSESKICIKVTEYTWNKFTFDDSFPGTKWVHIHRNGNDVVWSMVKRGWFTDDYMRSGFLDKTFEGVPWFLSKYAAVGELRDVMLSLDGWTKYNQTTRCAAVWRSVTEKGIDSDMLQIKYENLSEYDFNSLADNLGLKISKLTRKHIGSIRKPVNHPDITGYIQEPEKSRFLALMNRLEYV